MSSKLVPAFALALSLGAAASTADARAPRHPGAIVHAPVSQQVAFMGYLHDGRVATVYADGRVLIAPPKRTASAPADRRTALLQALHQRPEPPMQTRVPATRYGPLTPDLPAATRRRILFDLEHPAQRFASNRIVVVFKSGVTATQDHAALTPAAATSLRTALAKKRSDIAPHPFTTDARTNQTLMRLGVDRVDRLFANVDRGTLSALRGRAEGRLHRSLLAFDNAFVVHPGASSAKAALRALRASPSVAYAQPDFAVSPMSIDAVPLPAAAAREIAGYRHAPQTFGRAARSTARSFVPGNAAVAFNVQGFLNAPGVDAVAAFDEIGQRFGQLPGTGETITNVGLGDVYDASVASNPNDPCSGYAANIPPTTHLIGGQRYLDLPTMPLIPVWVSDGSGNLSTTQTVCGIDPFLTEIGLDFSVMAPLPHDAQRPGEAGAGSTDLLGIAPGASYRWIAPQDGSYTSILGAFIGAARQQPAPNVITASLGFGADAIGFPGRYEEDDALTQSVIAGIVSQNIVVCIAANDGTRTFTAAAVGPSGGSAATNVGTTATDINDVYYSTAPSVVPDSGAIDVGATTLNDVFSANPADPAVSGLANTLAFAETRFNGMLAFSSGFGSRVNVSAPGDNIESLFLVGPSYDGVISVLTGGTSASAPEVAAAAAVALQVGRLSGHPFGNPLQVRDALAATGTPVANPPQADVPLNVGPQISVRRLVERLLSDSGKPVPPSIARVAVYGRRSGAFIAQFNEQYLYDATYVTALDPSFIKLDGPYTLPSGSFVAFHGTDTGADLNSYITIAPDWEGIPANATYRLSVAGQPSRVLATTPWTRMLPARLLAAAGVPLTPGATKTITLTYSASAGLHVLAQSTFQLTFGPPATASRLILAPVVPAVVNGATIPVRYDFSGYPSALVNHPVLNVSMPGTGTMYTGDQQYPYYSVPLSGTSGTVQVPVSALAGAGVYAIWLQMQPLGSVFMPDVSDYAFTRVDNGTARPPAPLIAAGGSGPVFHSSDVPYQGAFAVSYDVSNVPGATGAIVEIAAPRPGPFFTSRVPWNTFRNPNGSTIDDNGVMTGSVYHVAAGGTRGTVTIDPAVAKIPITTTANVRVIATAGASPVGEASDADTVEILGIGTVLGLPLQQVSGNTRGTDGYLMEAASLGTEQSNVALYNAEPFDISTPVTSGIPFTSTTAETTFSPVVENDASVIWISPDFPTTMEYLRASPPAAGYTGFTFPSGTLTPTTFLRQVAKESSPTRTAMLGIDMATFTFLATRGDVMSGTDYAPAVDLTAQTGLMSDFLALSTFSFDPDADRAYLLQEDPNVDCSAQSPRLITIDFTAGTVSSRVLPVAGGATGGGYELAVDPGTHVAAVATNCQLGGSFRSELSLVDLTTGTTSRVFTHVLGIENVFHGFSFLLGGESVNVGIDSVNHLVLQRSMFCPSPISIYDVNARPCLNEYDEHGTLVKTVPGLFADGYADPSQVFNGVNGTTRSGFAMGQQIDTEGQFVSIHSDSVQPYRY
jgi:hypothetical protein